MGQTAEELLDSLTDEQIAAYTVDPSTEEHIVVGIDRIVTVPASLKRIAVQFDHNIESVTFDCPRFWDGHDMSEMVIYVNYLRPDNKRGSYRATEVTVDENDESVMHFKWTISSNVTEAKGNLSFLVCVKKVDEEGYEVNHWNSELNQEMFISQGLECETSIFEQYPDLITQLLVKMDTLGEMIVMSDDGNGNVNIEGLNTTLNLANAFSDKAVYSVGDYVMHYGVLYKCIIPVTVPGLFISTNWEPVNIVDELKTCFQYVSDGKTLIASAIIDMGVQTEATETFEQMANNIRSIHTGVNPEGTAETGDVTLGKTFINRRGILLTGTSTAASDLAILQVEHTGLRGDYAELQGNYNALSSEKDDLQADYTELNTQYTELSTDYNKYINAIVVGLRYSDLGVTEETTPEELEAILLAEFPDYAPYTVDWSKYYYLTLDHCTVGGGTRSNESCRCTSDGLTLSVTETDWGNHATNDNPRVLLTLSFETKGCNKVEVIYTGSGGSINGNVLTTVSSATPYVMDCTGNNCDITFKIEAVGPGPFNVTFKSVRFYYE